GIYYQLIDDAARMQAGHATIEHPGYRAAPAVDLWIKNTGRLRRSLERVPDVELTKLLVLGQGVARSGRGSVGVAVMGVEPSVEARTSLLAKHVVEGEYLADSDEALVVIGSKLARQLRVEVGKKLVLTANDADGLLVEELFRVKGIFETGTDVLDGYVLQAPFHFVARFYSLPEDSATQLGIVIRDAHNQERAFKNIEKALEGERVSVYPWQEIMPDLAAYIKVDKSTNIVMQSILMVLILFTIFNTILMSVLEREREFGVLQAIGSSPGLLRRQVVVESALIGLLGCGIGTALGWAVSHYFEVVGIDISKLLEKGAEVSGFAISPIIRPLATYDVLAWPFCLVLVATVLLSLISIGRIRDDRLADTLRHG
ncbi:MAG: FtsX-like permease family protein, partial [bacterium]